MRIIFILLILVQSQILKAQDTSTTKPWTYWWWMGSAVTREDITAQLKYFKASGLGGAHIIPIYGVKGYEGREISFLSARWLDMMQHTIREGKRLGLGVDMTTGTGWPFGGPNVTPNLAAKNMTFKGGEIVVVPTNQKVKRAAPGGEGLVLDPFSPIAMDKYLTRFDSAFYKNADKPRSMYMDSYEAYGANWTTDFLDEFESRRGYSLRNKIKFLTDSIKGADAVLVKIDYHQTLSELLYERYALPWAKWSKSKGFLTRYQAHGSPGNLLDLYAAADIPETESFGTSRFDIPGIRVDPDYSINQFGTPNSLAMKFASSAANISGKKLVSSETTTWLANHFKVSLSQIKPQIDELFTAGINHIFYHGTTYSPDKETYPGWLFYASTDYGKHAHFAEHFSLLNSYVEKCQALLQASKSDNDVLLYFPIHDLWATPAKSAGNVHLLEVHHVDRWLLDLPFGKLGEKLQKDGFTFDFISDNQVQKLKVDSQGNLRSGEASYKTMVIPATTYMPDQTLHELERLVAAGAKIIFQAQTPSIVTGFANHAHRQDEFEQTISALKKQAGVTISDNVSGDLYAIGVKKEQLSSKGLTFIRKKTKEGKVIYFVANLSNKFSRDWIGLPGLTHVVKNDPLSEVSILPARKTANGYEFYLSLPPGKSCFLVETSGAKAIPFIAKEQRDLQIKGKWELTFLKGKPIIPSPASFEKLQSWTVLPDSAIYFSGTALYRIVFDLPQNLVVNGSCLLDLGDVRETAKIKLNGKAIGTLWSIPFETKFSGEILKSTNNVLEIEVTNLSANYMRLRDSQSPDWKKFKDINIVDITYKPFDASKWDPMPSGILGPVKLVFE